MQAKSGWSMQSVFHAMMRDLYVYRLDLLHIFANVTSHIHTHKDMVTANVKYNFEFFIDLHFNDMRLIFILKNGEVLSTT